MLSRYSHVRMEAKRRELDGIVTRQREADEKHTKAPAQKGDCGLSTVNDSVRPTTRDAKLSSNSYADGLLLSAAAAAKRQRRIEGL